MRDSEALLLGATMLKPLRGCFLTEDGMYGCAMGMIYVAGPKTSKIPAWTQRTKAVLPCICRDLPNDAEVMSGGGRMVNKGAFEKHTSVHGMIVHLFNQHVCDGDWTIEQLADWISKVEPTPAEESKPVTAVVEEPIYSAT